MKKVKLEFKAPENKTIEYNGITITVNPFLEVGAQSVLIEHYLEDYFSEKQEDDILEPYAKAEYNLLNYVFQICTNIDTENFDGNLYDDKRNLVEPVLETIENYWDFRNILLNIVNRKEEQIRIDNSIGKILTDLVDKAYELLEKFSEVKPEEIEKLQKTGIELAERLEKSSIIGKPVRKPRQKKA